MSISLVLNDNTPTPAPTNGCCASVSDISGVAQPVHLSMALNGTAGTGNTGAVINVSTTHTAIYYVGVAGDLSGQTITAGTWTVTLHTVVNTGAMKIDAIHICKADSSGNTLGTIGAATSLNSTLGGTQSFSISGSSTSFGATDIVVISFQMHETTSGTITVYHDQTITAPPFSGGGGGGGGGSTLVQHICGSAINSLTLNLPSQPVVGNMMVVAGYYYIPSSQPTSSTISDTGGGNNTYISYLSQIASTTDGGDMHLIIAAAQINSNSGSPFAVTIQPLLTPSSSSYWLSFCAFEVSGLSSNQPDVAVTHILQVNGGTSLTVPSQTPSVNGDFAVTVFIIDNSLENNTYSVTSPTGFTVSQSQIGQTEPLNGEIDYDIPATTATLSPAWTSISPSAAVELGGMVLFQAASPLQTVTMSAPGLIMPLGLANATADAYAVQSPVSRALVRGLPALLQQPTFFLRYPPTTGVVRGLAVTLNTTGDTTQSQYPALPMVIGLPVQLLDGNPVLRVKRGPLTALLNGTVTIVEGEFYEAGIVESSVSYTILFQGGHDGALKVVGGGDQVVTAKPTWTPPANMVGTIRLWDTANFVYYVSSGGAWKTSSTFT